VRLELAKPATPQPTTAGAYFVSNYPPFQHWSADALPGVLAELERPPDPKAPLGLYVHVPFCRKRCRFCYFKVYTERNSTEIAEYVDAVSRELELHARSAALAGRKPRFVYFGGGTPSYLSASQIDTLSRALRRALPWDDVEEVTFECEPGTISEPKLRALKDMGVTRLSLGVENFDDAILESNGRAHLSRQVLTAFEVARRVGLPQVNLDLIAGMVGETEENWKACISRTIELDPDSVTVYQMEVPFNTTLYRELRADGGDALPVADWPTKRRWVAEAFAEFEAAGYRVSSAYTVTKADRKVSFAYRDHLWRGADLLGLGVSAFSHVNGAHLQNEKDIERYLERVRGGARPLQRGLVLTPDERLVREFILQLKLGRLAWAPFSRRFGVDPRTRFAAPLAALEAAGLAALDDTGLLLTRDALLRVDSLLAAFYRPEHRAEAA
jgi:oxygen-independent coproporphyrinogen-3 oxidase